MSGDELEHGLALMRSGEFFAAHEELEIAWREAPEGERDFYQGLVHAAVAWYQAGRGRPVACASQLGKARRRLEAFTPEHAGVGVASLLEQIDAAAAIVSDGSLELPPLRI